MHGFRGNHRSADRGKKGRKIKAYHHDEACKCSAPFLKLHYNDCPVLTKPCPIHGNGHLRSLKQDKADREQNVAVSNNPSSKTERLFRPVKSLLNVCDPETRFSFRYCSPKNSSSHESVKPQTDSDNFKMNLNKLFVEKAKPFVAGQTNKIKKLKQCFHSPCNSILQKSRSHTFVKEKTGGVRRELYTMMPEMPPDEKRCDIGFNWLPPGKLGLKSSEKKNDWVLVAGEESTQDFNNKLFGGSCLSKKGVKEIPIFGFPKEATQFVYSSFTYRDNRRKPTDDKSPSGQKRIMKDRRPTKDGKQMSSPSEIQTTSSDDSIYFAPFLLRPTAETESEKRQTVVTATISTQTNDEMRKRLTVALQTDQKEFKDSEVQTGRLTFPAEDVRPREIEAFKIIRCEPESEETYPSAASDDFLETSVPETDPHEDICGVGRNVSYVIQKATDNEAKESIHERGIQTNLTCHDAEQATHSQQTSLHEELCNAVSDLTELKNIIHEYFKKAEPLPQTSKAKVVDHETMTDSFLLKSSKKAFVHAESQTTQESKAVASSKPSAAPAPAPSQAQAPAPAAAAAPAPQDFQCIEIEDLERAAVLCVCSLCGKEIQTFTINIAASTESNAPLLEVIDKANAVDIYSELIEMKSTRTKVKNPDSGHSIETVAPAQPATPKPTTTKKASQDPARLAAYEMWNSSPSSSVVIKTDPPVCVSNKPRQKSETPSSQLNNCKVKAGQSGKSVSPSPKERQSRDCTEPRKSRKSSEFYYPVFIKPFMSKQFSKMLEKKFNDNASEESDSSALKQKRTYDKYFESSDIPAGKKIKQGFEHPREYFCKESPSVSDIDRRKRDGKPLQKGFGLLLPLATEHFCGKHSLKKSKDRKPKDLSHVKSLSLGSLNNLFTAEGCRHLKPIPIGCDEQSFRELLESSTCKSVKLLKSNAEGVFYHPWPNGILAAYEADEGSMSSSFDDKKLPTTPSCENTPNDEEIYEECTCCRSSNDSNDSNNSNSNNTNNTNITPDTIPMAEIVEEAEERDWESHSRRPEAKSKGRKSRSFSAYPHGTNSECGGTFWFGRDHKRK